jgi:hypothetical protein
MTYRERHLYVLLCHCGRQIKTLKKGRAKKGLCKYCRRGVDQNENQAKLPI